MWDFGIFQNLLYRWRWDRQGSAGAFHFSVAGWDMLCRHFISIHIIAANRRPDNIHDGVHRPGFVKLNLVNWHFMYLRFRFGFDVKILLLRTLTLLLNALLFIISTICL